jgi:hypothetical protein
MYLRRKVYFLHRSFILLTYFYIFYIMQPTTNIPTLNSWTLSNFYIFLYVPFQEPLYMDLAIRWIRWWIIHCFVHWKKRIRILICENNIPKTGLFMMSLFLENCKRMFISWRMFSSALPQLALSPSSLYITPPDAAPYWEHVLLFPIRRGATCAWAYSWLDS